MNKRYLGAVLISPLLIFIFLGGAYLHFLTLALSIIGMYEFYRAVEHKGINSMAFFGYTLCIAYYLILFFKVELSVAFFMLILATLLMMCIPVLNLKYNFIDVSNTVLGFIYVAVFFSFIPLIGNKIYGSYLIWLVFLSSWSTDTLAYYAGRAFGRRKLCEKVSPKKTVEGSIGGLLGSTLVCGIYGLVVSSYVSAIPVYNFFIIGALCGMICQFGDLVASSIKRHVGIKDYSDLIPGHGGILDRFDSS